MNNNIHYKGKKKQFLEKDIKSDCYLAPLIGDQQ